MINHVASPHRSTRSSAAPGEQLSLLPGRQVTARFRLSTTTRERGLRHVAEIRQMLAERAAASSRTLHDAPMSEPRHDQAA